jgi:hypothetical protein
LLQAIQKQKIVFGFTILLLGITGYINLWWTYFAHKPGVRLYSINNSYYWHSVGRWNITNEVSNLLTNKESDTHFPYGIRPFEIFEFSKDGNTFDSIFYKIGNPNLERVRASFQTQTSCKEWNNDSMVQLIAICYAKGIQVKTNMIKPQLHLENDKNEKVYLDILSKKDNIDSIVFCKDTRNTTCPIIFQEAMIFEYSSGR